MKVLFLGGPWHDHRHDITEPLPDSINVMPPAEITVEVAALDDPIADMPTPVSYQLRHVAPAGKDWPPGQRPRRPVYATYGYDGPWRY